MSENHGVSRVVPAEAFRRFMQLFIIIQFAGKHGNSAVLQQILKMIPLLKGEEHVRPNHQGQPRTRVHLLQFTHGIVCIALAVSQDLQIRNLNTPAFCKGESAEFQTFFGRRTSVLHHFVGRLAVRHNQKPVRMQFLQYRLDCRAVS